MKKILTLVAFLIIVAGCGQASTKISCGEDERFVQGGCLSNTFDSYEDFEEICESKNGKVSISANDNKTLGCKIN